jgi:hypothetical protein
MAFAIVPVTIPALISNGTVDWNVAIAAFVEFRFAMTRQLQQPRG